MDLVRLCISLNIKPSVAPSQDRSVDALRDLLEQKVKEVTFLYSYLNEKVQKRNLKCKSILHPQLQKKQILAEALRGVWDSQMRVEKQKLEREAKEMSE